MFRTRVAREADRAHRSGMRGIWWGGLLTVSLMGCASGPTRYTIVAPRSAQTISLLGDTLWSLPVNPSQGQARVARLQRARELSQEKPHDPSTQILLALRTAELGRFREAIEVTSTIIGVHPRDPRLYRRRGDLLLRIREFDLALRDLRFASQEALAHREGAPEFNEVGIGGLVETTLVFSSLRLLGLTLYLDGSFAEARNILQEALKRAVTADELADIALWLFYATHQAGLRDEARNLILQLPDTLEVNLAHAAWDMLQAFRGDLSLEELPIDLQAPLVSEDDATYGYGIGFALMALGRLEEAALLFHRVRAIPDWSTLPYLAAEAELARMQSRLPRHP